MQLEYNNAENDEYSEGSDGGDGYKGGDKGNLGGKWSADEDNRLKDIVKLHGPKNWKKIAGILGNTRTDVQCLHRWNKVLKVSRNFTRNQLHSLISQCCYLARIT